MRRSGRLPLPVRFAHFLLVAAGLFGAGPAAAFHEAGVGACGGCHIMHQSQDGQQEGSGVDGTLLLYGSATDLCLSCHADQAGQVLGNDPLHPPAERGAGNFAFLRAENLNDGADGLQHPIPGSHAGHSIVSLAWNLPADADRPLAPGGNFPSAQLGCTSCHDPHGTAGFRMLRGEGSLPNGFVFTYPAPLGAGIALAGAESRDNHTAYNSGWSEWCANCHVSLDDHQAYGFHHPVSADVSSEGDVYNGYDGPDNPEGGVYQTAYLPELPLEDPAATVNGTAGAGANSRLSCLTCHRAHATSAPAALRWDPNVVRLAEDGTVSGSYAIPDPYAHPEQRALCVKCHWPSASQHGMDAPCMSCHLALGAQGAQAAPGTTGGVFRFGR